MIINALNSGANMFMADFEDANSPNVVKCHSGQINLHDAIRRQIDFTSPEGKDYKLNVEVATLLVRPRGWHCSKSISPLMVSHCRVRFVILVCTFP